MGGIAIVVAAVVGYLARAHPAPRAIKFADAGLRAVVA